MKAVRYFLLGALSLLVCWFCLMFFILGVFVMDCRCFAADSSGDLYIGSRDTVYVYSGDVLVRQMPMMGKGGVFTIQDDDTILWADSLEVYITDLKQNIIDHRDDPGSEEFYRLKGNIGGNRVFVSKDGTCYEKENQFGGFRILKDSEVVYSSPASGRILLVGLIASAVVGIGCIVLCRKENINERNTKAKTMDQ